MNNVMLLKSIQFLLKKEPFLTHSEIATKLKKDKARISGYLEALVDLEHVQVKKAGNSKAYYMGNKRGK